MKCSECDYRSLYYKTFYGRNLRIFVVSLSVCPWKGSSILRKSVNYGRKKIYRYKTQIKRFLEMCYFWKLVDCDCLKGSSQNGNILGNILLKQIFLCFLLKNSFKM
jgi:hypothetical protein